MTFTQSAKSISVMKTPIKTLIACCLIGSFSPAFAASTVDLTVKGLIVPSACTPSLSANTVDVGRVSVKDLNQEAETQLTPTTLTLSVNCLSPTLFAMKATDNRADSAISTNAYGIGRTAAGEGIGGYFLLLDNPMADAAAVLTIASISNGTTWFRHWNDDAWDTTYLLSIKAADGASIPIPAKDTQMELSVNPFILPAKNMTITEDTAIDGSATIEVKYL
jgi:type 1 fimbria pilin